MKNIKLLLEYYYIIRREQTDILQTMIINDKITDLQAKLYENK